MGNQEKMIQEFADSTKEAYSSRDTEWKKETDKLFFGKEWVKEVSELFQNEIFESSEGEIVILSPTANTASNEVDIFNELKKHNNNINFIAGDIIDTEIDERIAEADNFGYLRLNALHLPFAENSVDIIFDKKGLLWHSCAESIGSDERDVLFQKTLEEYFSVLKKENGKIIIDAIEDEYAKDIVDKEAIEIQREKCKKEYGGDESKFRDETGKSSFFSFKRNSRFKDMTKEDLANSERLAREGVLQGEISTYSLLMYVLEQNEELKKFFEKNYECRLLGSKKPHLLAEIKKIN